MLPLDRLALEAFHSNAIVGHFKVEQGDVSLSKEDVVDLFQDQGDDGNDDSTIWYMHYEESAKQEEEVDVKAYVFCTHSQSQLNHSKDDGEKKKGCSSISSNYCKEGNSIAYISKRYNNE